MKQPWPRITSVLALMALGACTYAEGSVYGGEHIYRGGYGPPIPEGHMPPPGECRIWYPDLPAGQQPPPGPCGALQYQVPPGAYLVRG